jgi:ATP-dependent Clp protease protease subunit
MSNRENVFINTDKRIFYIHDEIDEDSMSKVCYSLLYLLNEDQEKENKEKDFKREPIKIYINSVGGYVQDMWALVDIMLNSKTPIYTYSTGYAHSCGFMIFVAGTKRFITKHTKMCCHQFSGGATGMYQDIKEKVEDLDRMWRDFEEYICAQTKITKARLQEIREKKLDWYIYSEESIGLGVATDIVDAF